MKKIYIIIILFSLSILYGRDLNEILSSGYLIIGIRNVPSDIIYQSEDPERIGFCYELAKTYADYLKVDLKVVEVPRFIDYWTKDGEIILGKDVQETPDIYSKVDIVADIITVTAEREKIVNMIPFVENAEILYGKKDLIVNDFYDLKGKRVITGESFHFYQTLIEELNKRNIKYVINKITIDNNKIKFLGKYNKPKNDEVDILLLPIGEKYISNFFFYQVILDKADVSTLDSFSFFAKLLKTYVFKEYLKPLFVISEKIGYLAFCTSYETPQLNDSLEKFILEFKTTEKYNHMIKKYIDIDYKEYIKFLRKGK
ncbi:hypothetical protein JCM30566_10870 [Marinitoga arctica]